MIHELVQRILTDPSWPVLIADDLATLAVALMVIAYTAWSNRHD